MTQDARIPVSVVVGTAGARRTALVRGWLDRRPAGARWAVLVNAPGTAGLHSPLREGAAAFEGVAGCACCTGKVVARAALVKLLRRRPWSRLLVELGEQADPGGQKCAHVDIPFLRSRHPIAPRPVRHLFTARRWRKSSTVPSRLDPSAMTENTHSSRCELSSRSTGSMMCRPQKKS